MSGATLDPRLTSPRTAPRKAFQLSWADPRFRNIVWQAVILGSVGAIVWYLVANTSENLANRRIATGFDYLGRIAGFGLEAWAAWQQAHPEARPPATLSLWQEAAAAHAANDSGGIAPANP